MADVSEKLTGDIEIPISSSTSGSDLKEGLMALNVSNPAVVKAWLLTRKQNIRSWATFLNTGRVKVPTSAKSLSSRFVRNIDYFQSNYLFVFLGLFLFCLLTSPLLLLVLVISFGGCYLLRLRNAEGLKLKLMGHDVSITQQYVAILLCSIPLLYLAGAGSAVFWVIGASFFVIALHATLYNIDAIEGADDSFDDLNLQEV